MSHLQQLSLSESYLCGCSVFLYFNKCFFSICHSLVQTCHFSTDQEQNPNKLNIGKTDHELKVPKLQTKINLFL
jgi:hypothetical protein